MEWFNLTYYSSLIFGFDLDAGMHRRKIMKEVKFLPNLHLHINLLIVHLQPVSWD